MFTLGVCMQTPRKPLKTENSMVTTNPNLTPEGNFTLTYFPYVEDAVPHTPLEEAIQYLFDCLPKTDEEILQNIQRYHQQCRPLTRKKKQQLMAFINNVLLPACKEGNQDAIYWMYYAYFYGIGVDTDIDKALEYLTIIADYGYPDMQYELGFLYNDCDSLNKGWRSRKHEAAHWLEKAAVQGNVEAMYMLGTIYDSYRWGVRHFRKRAFVWFKRAADLGHDEAMCSLCWCYKLGRGTKKDHEKALEWAEKAGWHQEAERLRNGEDQMDEDGFDVYTPMLSWNQDELF